MKNAQAVATLANKRADTSGQQAVSVKESKERKLRSEEGFMYAAIVTT